MAKKSNSRAEVPQKSRKKAKAGVQTVPENQESVNAEKVSRKLEFAIPLKAAIALVVLILASVAVVIWPRYTSINSPIPSTISKDLQFPLYYPTKLPNGYTFDKSSVKVENDILFFSLRSSAKKILISEQAIPSNPPDLKKIDGFNTFDTSSGSAAIGNTNSNVAVILLTDESLISINGSKGAARQAVIETARQMRRL